VRFVGAAAGFVGSRVTQRSARPAMQGMTQPIRFILGSGAVVAFAQPTPTASARRSAAQPKTKRAKGKTAKPRRRP
jgi:hypothetical protein